MLIGVDGFRSTGRPGATITRRFADLALGILFIMTLLTVCPCSTSDDGIVAKRIKHDAGDNSEEYLPTKVVRRFKLYNRCSGGFLQFYYNPAANKSIIDAKGKNLSPLVDLRVETDSYGSRIRIKFEKLDKYLCFNKRRRVTTKWVGRDRGCIFVERISDNYYTELESVSAPGVYLGFNKEGRFLDYTRYNQRRTCFQFIKSDTDHLGQFQEKPNYRPNNINITTINRHNNNNNNNNNRNHHRHRHRHSKHLHNHQNISRRSEGIR